jgi:hypothetical protein
MKLWRVIYGTLVAGLVILGLIAAAANLHSMSEKTIAGLKVLLGYGLPIQLGIIVLSTVVERIARPAGPRKSFKGYALNLQVTILNFSDYT